ncbi:SRPBCC family protein [soil metagenome]
MPNSKEGSVHLHRVIRAPAERIYRAFLDPDALAKWLPPNGFSGKVHEMDARIGQKYKMSFTNFSSGLLQSWTGTFLELVPNERIQFVDKFDDPALAGEMQKTIVLKQVAVGTDVDIMHEGIPEMIPVESCYLGWQESLAQLTLLVEAEISR